MFVRTMAGAVVMRRPIFGFSAMLLLGAVLAGPALTGAAVAQPRTLQDALSVRIRRRVVGRHGCDEAAEARGEGKARGER